MFDQPIVVVILLLFLLLLFLRCLGRSCRHVLVPNMLTQKANGLLAFRLSDSSNWPHAPVSWTRLRLAMIGLNHDCMASVL